MSTTAPPPRIGVLRPASASTDPAVALAEARVIRHELARRLGEVSIDLRNDGATIDPWLPLEHAAWPGDVDATIDLTPVTGTQPPRLLALFARTVEPAAADVRWRMLHHLGILPVEQLDDAELERRLPRPQRPTDLWLVVRDATELDVTETRLDALRSADSDETRAVDGWLDEVVAGLSIETGPMIARLTARVAELESALAEATSAAARSERLALDRIDELQAECDVLRERLARTELDTAR